VRWHVSFNRAVDSANNHLKVAYFKDLLAINPESFNSAITG